MISILVPSRGRPQGFKRLVDSAFGLASGPDALEVVVYLDDDDPKASDYQETVEGRSVIFVRGPRICLSEMWNRCFESASGEILMHCGDDIVFREPQDWDQLIEGIFAATEDRILLVFGRDGIQDEALATHSFLHRRWAEASGFFVPPYFVSDFNDVWLDAVARMVDRRRFVPELYTEHMHVTVGKADWDQNYKDRTRRHTQDRPDVIYATKHAERVAHANRLRAVMK